MRFSAYLLVVPLILSSSTITAFTQDSSVGSPTIRVIGEGSVHVMPDQAMIQIIVVTEATEADQATDLNDRIAQEVLSQVRKIVEAGTEIKTTTFSLKPTYQRTKEFPRKITGYTAKNHILVKTGDLTRVGKIIDAATDAGANEIGSIQFTLKDEHPVRLKALKQATANAREKAEEMAATLGLKIARILLVEEAGAQVHRPIAVRGMMLQAASVSPSTPVEPGLIEIRGSVSLTAEVVPME